MPARRVRILFMVIGAALASAAPAAAQFTTPDRQFHNQTSFPLEGRHRAVACESCHMNGVYKGTPMRCFDCHWVRRQDDRYRLQLGTQCEQCHRPSGWADARWDHGAMTAMPLSGAHRQIACASCHRNSVFTNTSMACVSCHEREYQATRAPNHAAAGFPMTCETCHRASDTSFRGAGFNHAGVFPLVGVHAQQACASCHRNNVYRGTPRECVGCHVEVYNRTSAPNHVASGFSTACQGCHRATDTTWRQGTFNHRFPIRSGPHRQTCTTCHTSSSSFQTFTCLVCHEHSQPRMDEKHRERRGYRYDSLACYGCHPTGRGD